MGGYQRVLGGHLRGVEMVQAMSSSPPEKQYQMDLAVQTYNPSYLGRQDRKISSSQPLGLG